MSQHPYVFQYMPKLILSSSFDFGFEDEMKMASIVDDPDVLRKVASSPVVHQWGEITPKQGHSMIHLIAMGAHEFTGPNRNGDSWKGATLAHLHPTFQQHGALYKDHINKDHSKRYGDVEKTAYNDEMGRVELLVAADHSKCADWLGDIERGKRVDFSMGFDCEYDVCSICNNKAPNRSKYCEHVKKGAKSPFGMGRVLEDGRKCYVDNPKGKFNDISKVGTGADMIAQHLRKVAGIGDVEIIGGADLFALYGEQKTAGIEQSVKMAIAHKCSRMEKIVPMVGYRPDSQKTRLHEKLSSKLRSVTPGEMFAELSKVGALLDFREFFKLALGDSYGDFVTTIDLAEPYSHHFFSKIANDSERLARICRNGAYDVNKVAARVLTDYERYELAQEFSLDPELAEDRLVKQALFGDQVPMQEGLVGTGPSSIQSLLDEYAAYKLAALEACQLGVEGDVVRMATMTS